MPEQSSMPRQALRVCLEQGKTWTFATAIDWPGWCRRAKGDVASVETLVSYQSRYAKVVGSDFRPGPVEIIGRLPGNATTDFGAPDAIGPWDREPYDAAESDHAIGLVQACWRYFDSVVAGAPRELRKGPRGGGRDRDKIVEHVREAERAYGRHRGVRLPPRTPVDEQRTALIAALRDTDLGAKWPLRYAIRRIAWHVLDHAWEIEDRSD